MIKLPKVQEVILCREFAVDAAAHQASLMGLFQSLTFGSFPAHIPLFIVYFALYDGEGGAALRVTISRAVDESDVSRYSKWIGLSPGHVSNQPIAITRCVFPAPGRYLILVHFDGQLIASRILDVFGG